MIEATRPDAGHRHREGGKLDKLTIKLEEPKRTAEEQKLLDQKTQEAKNKAQ